MSECITTLLPASYTLRVKKLLRTWFIIQHIECFLWDVSWDWKTCCTSSK